MDFFVTNSDNSLVNKIADPEELVKVAPHLARTFEYLKELQKFTDDQAVIKNGAKVAGGAGDIKIVARFPQGLAMVLDKEFPGFMSDSKQLHKMLKKYPIYAAYSRKATGGAA